MALEARLEATSVNLLFFAKSRELTGLSHVTLALPFCTTSGKALLEHLISLYPKLSVIRECVVLAVNQEYLGAEEEIKLHPGDEVAIIPPISGGVIMSDKELVRISAEPLSQEEVLAFVTDPTAGGISIFIGTTRDNFNGKTVVELEYEAYTAMALKQLRQICTNIRQKWPVCKIAILHRIGIVPVCESSVIIAVSAEHRREAIDSVSYAIEAVKKTATIWKKEKYKEGGEEWKENKEWVPPGN